MSDRLGLFQGVGIELEYMIVDRTTLAVAPKADLVLGNGGDVERGEFAWSNELALHVVELKCNGPAPGLLGLDRKFQGEVNEVNRQLGVHGLRLMPTAMHPWMRPNEAVLWPHEYTTVYRAFDRIFDCRGHGWSNLQSMHINLPFGDDGQFGLLHAAIRLVLPILPCIAASSPVVEGKLTGMMDTRLEFDRLNARRVPDVSGDVVPEAVFTEESYRREILGKVYQALEPHDADGILRHEWANARGAIARFDRDAIEIRVIDVQESPAADMAIAAAVVAVVRALVEERLSPNSVQREWPAPVLGRLFRQALAQGEELIIEDDAYLEALGYLAGGPVSARELWSWLVERLLGQSGELEPWSSALGVILGQGTLSRRIGRALGPTTTPEGLREVYGRLCDCLSRGTLFVP